MVFRRFSTRFTPDQRFLGSAIAISGTLFFVYASLRHFLLRSTGYDLGIFDHIVYRLSANHPPLEIFNNIHNPHHFLTDHFAWILYPISWLYRLYPTVYWLLFLQGFALALAVWPLWQITQHHRLPRHWSRAVVVVYLLYPVIFNVNILDFHNDAFAPLFLFGAIWAAYQDRLLIFLFALLLLFGCKEMFSLTALGLGLWLCTEPKRYRYGAIAMGLGLSYFVVTTQLLIPLFGKSSLTGLGRYSSLGGSFSEILQNLVFKPGLVATHLFTVSNGKYLAILLLPMLWALSPQTIAPLLGALPALALNLLTTFEGQKTLTNHYSLVIVPFLLMVVTLSLKQRHAWLRRPRWLIAWSLVCFMALGKPGYLLGRFVEGLDTWSASRDAIALIDDHSPVLVPMHIAPHVTHRLKVGLATDIYINEDLRQYKYVMLDKIYPGIHTPLEIIQTFQDRLEADSQFELEFERDQVYLYHQKMLYE